MDVGTKTLHSIKRVPQWSHIGSTVVVVAFFTLSDRASTIPSNIQYFNHHVGTPKQKQTSYYTVFLDQEFQTKVQ